MANLPILVVEDEPDGQELVARMLSHANLQVVVAGTAEDAWVYLHQQTFAGAIIDLALPGQDGFQLVSAIRDEASIRALPCMAVTAFHTSELRHQALEQGFDAYLPKPLNRTLFLSAVADLFAS